MDDDKLSRQVTLVCSTCGCSQFSHAGESEEDCSIVTCEQCGRQMTRDELLVENSENLEAHAAEMAEEAVSASVKQLTKSLQDAFKGNKSIRFK